MSTEEKRMKDALSSHEKSLKDPIAYFDKKWEILFNQFVDSCESKEKKI